jgi:hypothetical protein
LPVNQIRRRAFAMTDAKTQAREYFHLQTVAGVISSS